MLRGKHRLALGISISLHVAVISYFLFENSKKTATQTEKISAKKPLEVRSLSEKELNELEARKRLQNTGVIVQSDEQIINNKAPTSKTEKIFLSKNDQSVDRNTRAPRIGEFKNVLDEGLISGDERKKQAGAEAVKAAKKEKGEAFDAKNLFALATNYEETSESKTANDASRTPSSVLSPAGGKKGQGLSATDDYLEGIATGANTLLNTQQFKYYSFYERIRGLLVERWRARIRREIAKVRSPAADGSSRLGLGSKITKLQVKIGPNGNINSVEKVGISGIDSFDNAAEISFREAAPFPHPPEEMLKDQEVTIQWDFVVVVEDASLVQFNVNRSL